MGGSSVVLYTIVGTLKPSRDPATAALAFATPQQQREGVAKFAASWAARTAGWASMQPPEAAAALRRGRSTDTPPPAPTPAPTPPQVHTASRRPSGEHGRPPTPGSGGGGGAPRRPPSPRVGGGGGGGNHGASDLASRQPWPARLRSLRTRTLSTALMLAGFAAVLWAGHVVVCVFIMCIQARALGRPARAASRAVAPRPKRPHLPGPAPPTPLCPPPCPSRPTSTTLSPTSSARPVALPCSFSLTRTPRHRFRAQGCDGGGAVRAGRAEVGGEGAAGLPQPAGVPLARSCPRCRQLTPCFLPSLSFSFFPPISSGTSSRAPRSRCTAVC